jgi:hypothetical protein
LLSSFQGCDVALVVISSDAKWRTTWVSKALQFKGIFDSMGKLALSGFCQCVLLHP